MYLGIAKTFFSLSFDYKVFKWYAVTNYKHTQEIPIFDLAKYICTVLAVHDVTWYILLPDAAWECFRVEFQPAIDRSDIGTELLVHKVTILNVFKAPEDLKCGKNRCF